MNIEPPINPLISLPLELEFKRPFIYEFWPIIAKKKVKNQKNCEKPIEVAF